MSEEKNCIRNVSVTDDVIGATLLTSMPCTFFCEFLKLNFATSVSRIVRMFLAFQWNHRKISIQYRRFHFLTASPFRLPTTIIQISIHVDGLSKGLLSDISRRQAHASRPGVLPTLSTNALPDFQTLPPRPADVGNTVVRSDLSFLSFPKYLSSRYTAQCKIHEKNKNERNKKIYINAKKTAIVCFLPIGT